jgi:hypothetical protein
MRTYPWPENFDELREAVALIVQIAREGSVRKAAPALHMARTSLQYWMERLGLRMPLTRSGFSPESGPRRRARTHDTG